MKHGKRKIPQPIGDADDPHGLYQAMQRYLDYLKTIGRVNGGIVHAERFVRDFLHWCDMRDLKRPGEINRNILERYQRMLVNYRKKDGKPLTIHAQRAKLIPLRAFFKWLARRHEILNNPAAEMELPKRRRRLPRYVLTAQDVEAIVRQPNIFDTFGLRDRAVIEMLYSSGLRRMEMAHLDIHDLDVDRKTVFVREGKGRKDRIIPISDRALHWNLKYLNDARPKLISNPKEEAFYLTQDGERFNENWLSHRVSCYVGRARIGKRGGCHLFRHTLATLMLENGADLRYIQAMLGHEEIKTTELYTHVAVRQLQIVHQTTHPAWHDEEYIKPKTKADIDQEDDERTRAEILNRLVAEMDEERDDVDKRIDDENADARENA